MNAFKVTRVRLAPAGFTLAVSLLAAGCGSGDTTSGPAPTPARASIATSSPVPFTPDPVGWQDDVPAAPAAGKVGPDGNCTIPGSFAIPANWTARDVANLGVKQEGLELRCEVETEPAGVVGGIRAWVANDGTKPRAALEKFVRMSTLQATNIMYRETKIGSVDGVEVTYQFEHHVTRAFAVDTAGQVLLVVWGAEEEYLKEGLPVYVLARTTYAPAG